MKNGEIQKQFVTIFEPRFNQALVMPLGFSWRYFVLGPLLSIKEKNYFEAIFITLASLLTLGGYHVYFAFIYNEANLLRYLNRGYPYRAVDEDLIIALMKKNKMVEIKGIKMSRLNSLDGTVTFKPKL